MSNYQKRDKFFYALPRLFPNWDYPTRNAIGMKLDDFWAKDADKYRFLVKGKMYEIAKEKAHILGNKFSLRFGSLPNIIPLDEFEIVSEVK